MLLHDKLRGLREDHDETQTELAKKMNTSQRRISHLETGDTEITIQDLILYCKIYNVSADELLGITNDQ